jgi:hypothetical protein
VELHPRAERAGGVGRRVADALHERDELAAQVALEVDGVAGRLGGRVVDLAVPVDLVEDQRRPAPVRPLGDAAQPVLEQELHLGGEAERVARPPGDGQGVGHLAVDDEVLRGVGVRHRGRPARHVRMAARRRRVDGLEPGRRLHELRDDAARAGVLPRRALVPAQRRGGVHVQEVGVDHRVDRRRARPVAVERRAPDVVEPLGDLVGERPVAGLVPGVRGRGHGERDDAGQQAGDDGSH